MSEPSRINRKRKAGEIIDLSNDDSNHNRESNEPAHKKQRIQQIGLKEYECPVCKELPNGRIFQCNNGHLICNICYEKLDSVKCPICKIKMNSVVRNIIAEKALSLRIVVCTNNQCNKQMPFAQLKQHITECDYANVACKYAALGCSWSGFNKDQSDHENECKIDLDSVLVILNNLKINMRKKQEKHNIVEKAQCMEMVGIDFVGFDIERNETILESGSFRHRGHILAVQMKIKRCVGPWYTMRIRLVGFNPEIMLDERKLKIYVIFNETRNDRKYLKDLQFETIINENKTKSPWANIFPDTDNIYKTRMEEIIFDEYRHYIGFKVFLYDCTDDAAGIMSLAI